MGDDLQIIEISGKRWAKHKSKVSRQWKLYDIPAITGMLNTERRRLKDYIENNSPAAEDCLKRVERWQDVATLLAAEGEVSA